jgi:hypothetical protein
MRSSLRSCGVLLFALYATVLLLSPPNAAAQGIAGSYDGRYQCGTEWRQMSLQVHDMGGGRISAVFTFPVDPRMGGGEGAFSMRGTYDERTARFKLAPQQWMRHPRGYDMLGLDGTLDPSSRGMRGRVNYFGCQGFELAPQGTSLASLPPSPRPLPPERGKVVFNLSNYTTGPLEYWDSTMDNPGKARESEPIDDVIDWLKAQDFSCLGTQQVRWNADGTRGVASDRNNVRERYVIECDSDCRDLHYLPALQATMFHFAATQPVPVMEFKGIWLGGQNFTWQFTRARTSTPSPDVYIHRWSSDHIQSGQSCKAPKSSR